MSTNVNLTSAPGLLIRVLLDRVLGTDGAGEPAPPPADSRALAVIGRYENPAYGAVTVALRRGRLILTYNSHDWPLTWTSERGAAFTIEALGLQIPLTGEFELQGGRAGRLAIPFALDPRVRPEEFTRSHE